MAAKQLAKLKDQIKELLEKGYLWPSSPQEEPLCFSTRGRMVLNRCVCIIMLRMRLPSRTITHCLGLMVYLINHMVHVCSPRSVV
jgi:hypothetical protein